MFISCGSRIGTILATAALATLTAALPRPAAAGMGFSDPRALNNNASTDSLPDWLPDIAYGNGVWIAACYSNNDVGSIGTDLDILYMRSTDNGQTWSDPAPIADTAGSESTVKLATDGSGTWIAVWWTREIIPPDLNTDWDIVFSRSEDDGLTWTPAQIVNSNAQSAFDDNLPQIATNGSGVWMAVWQTEDDIGGVTGPDEDLLYSVSTDDGHSWSAIELLNSNFAQDPGDDYWPDIEYGAGRWVCVWRSVTYEHGPDIDVYYSYSDDDGATWAEMRPLNSNAAEDAGNDGYALLGVAGYNVNTATDGNGNWIAVWESSDDLGGLAGADVDVFCARSSDNGTSWSAPEVLNSNGLADPESASGADYHPFVATDRKGTWIVTWTSRHFSAPLYTDDDIAVSRSIDNGLTWTAISPLNAHMATDFEGRDDLSRIATDGADNWVVVWNSYGGFYSGLDFDILHAVTADIMAPPDPPLTASGQELEYTILDIILGKKVVDQNMDGIIDVADLLSLYDANQVP